MFQTVIFDLDGTILNTLEDLAAAGNWICRKRGWQEHTVEEYRQLVGTGMRNLLCLLDPMGDADPALDEALAEYMEYYGQHCMEKTAPYDGIPQLLAELRRRGLKLAVYSNKGDRFCGQLVEHYFPGVFHLIRGKVDGVPVKPDPIGLGRKLRDDIISGNKNDFYFGQWRFALSPELASNFVKTFGIHNYVKKKYGVNWEDLTDDTVKSKYESEYAEYSKLKEKNEIFTAYDMFSEIQDKVNKTLETVGGQVKNTNDLFESGSTLYETSMLANQVGLMELSKIREEIIASLPAGTTTSPELQQIDSDIKNLENQRAAIESNPLLRVSPALTKKGHDTLKTPQSTADDSQVAAYMDSYIKFLEHMNSNGLYMDPDDVHLLNVAGLWYSKNFGNSNLTQSVANSIQLTLENMASEEMDLSD